MLSRRDVLRAGLCAGAGALFAPMINRSRFRLFADELEVSARTLDLVGRATVIDMLGLFTLDWPKLYGWFREPTRFTENDFLKLKWTGIKVFHPAVNPDRPDAYGAALEWMAGWNNLLAGQPGRLRRVETAADLLHLSGPSGPTGGAAASGPAGSSSASSPVNSPAASDPERLGVLLGFQNADHFRTARDVEDFHRLGQRVSQLTYNDRNRLGSGCKEPQDTGLTGFGAEVVAAMNRTGMAVDVSHCGDRTSLDAVAASRKPVLITHSNCRALVANPRCKPDAVIRAVAASGGVMGITFVPAFAGPSLGAVLDHFDHVARLVGVEHVGLGSDTDVDALDPGTQRVRSRYALSGLHHARRTFQLAEGLMRRGYSDAQIELVLGANFARVLGEIWNLPPPAPPKVARPKVPGQPV
jgi:membrane dipeptidase